MFPDEQLHQRDALKSGLPPQLFKNETFGTGDVGKLFVINPSETEGQLMERKEFLALDVSKIGSWTEVGELDTKV
jgi:hypothetical protein